MNAPRTSRAPVREAARTEPEREPVRKTRTRRGVNTDPINIPDALLKELFEVHGIDLQWNTDTILGAPDAVGIMTAQQQGWEAVNVGDFEGRLDYLAPKGHKGSILYQGLRLDWRPMELTEEARAENLSAARQAVRTEEAKLRGGNLDGVTLDTSHPSARAKTFISKERIPSMPVPR